ncbi:MAG TPA: class I SAM-dependent methyltransferase [Thermoplasmata archaeon]|nr:class I SAM-dependent methyltransferase [Thermoplasmata archaeon]
MLSGGLSRNFDVALPVGVRDSLDIGCGPNKVGTVGMDRVGFPGVDVVHDLRKSPWPFPNGSFRRVIARQVLEHLPRTGVDDDDLLFDVMRESHRVLVPGGTMQIEVPHEDSLEAWGSPAHQRAFNEDTFAHFLPTRSPYWRKPIFRSMRVWVDRRIRAFGLTEWNLIDRAPRLYRALCMAHVGRPRNLHVELVK